MTPRPWRRGIAFAFVVATIAVAVPALTAWQRERALERAFAAEMQRIDLELAERRVKAGAGWDERAAQRWRFERTHALLRANRQAEAPRFRKRINLLLGVYDRTAKQMAASNRAAEVTLLVQQVSIGDLQDPRDAQRILQLITEAHRFARGFRAELDSAREYSRRAVADSGLPAAQRAEVWEVAERYYAMMQPSVEGAERIVPVLARLEALARFLELHHGEYVVYPGGAIQFTDELTQREWMVLQRKRWD